MNPFFLGSYEMALSRGNSADGLFPSQSVLRNRARLKSPRSTEVSHLVCFRLKMEKLRAFWNSPMGPKTSHFWGPGVNWGIVSAALVDSQKPPEVISGNMTSVMCVYSALFMRFAWMVQPRNLHLLTVHTANETVQLYQLSRWAKAQGYLQKKDEANNIQ